MELETKNFGVIEIEDDKIIRFEHGLIGFEAKRDFVIFGEEEDNPHSLLWLQCIEDSSLSLPIINPFAWYPTYSPDVDDEFIQSIGDLNEGDLQLFNVVVIRERVEDMTVNLKAPIVVNIKTKKGMQVIADNEELGVRHNLYEQMKFLRTGE